MSTSPSHRSSPQRRHAPYHRWPATEKAALLAAFPTSGQSAVVFCRIARVPLATFTFWQRQARRSAARRALARPVFARVALTPADGDPAASLGSASGIRAVIRSGTGPAIALDGLEASTVRDLVAMLLATGGGAR